MMTPDDWKRVEHDLKNQLGIVLGFIELLIEETPDSDSRRVDMVEIRRAAKACLSILEDSVSKT